VNVKDATATVFQVLNRYLDPHQIEKARQALPEQVRALWPSPSPTAGRSAAA
jgi:uncharacterized protein (DUF2267 family)